jgi:hypothetical protein
MALGKTQQQFATEVLPCAISTVARWETITPPEADVLKRLSGIAAQHGLFALASEFADLHMGRLKQGVPDLTVVPRTETEPEHGHLFIRLNGSDAIQAGQGFMMLVDALSSSNPDIQRKTKLLLAPLLSVAERLYGAPRIDKMGAVFTAAVAHGIPETAVAAGAVVPQPITTPKKKRGK